MADSGDDISKMLDAEIAGEVQHMKSGEATPAQSDTPPPPPPAADDGIAADAEAAMEAEIQARIRAEVEAKIRAEYQSKLDAEKARARAAAEEAMRKQAAEHAERLRLEEEEQRAEDARKAEVERQAQEEAFERECAEAEAAEQAKRDAEAAAVKAEQQRQAEEAAAAKKAAEEATARREAEERLRQEKEVEAALQAEAERRAAEEAAAAAAAAEEEAAIRREAEERIRKEKDAAAARQAEEAAAAAAAKKAADEEEARAQQQREAEAAAVAAAATAEAQRKADDEARKQEAREKLRKDTAERMRVEMEAAVERQRAEYEAKIRAMQEKLERQYSGGGGEESAKPSAPVTDDASPKQLATTQAAAPQPTPKFSSSDDDDDAMQAKPPGPSKRPNTSTGDVSAMDKSASPAPAPKPAPKRDIRKMAAAAAAAAAANPAVRDVVTTHAPESAKAKYIDAQKAINAAKAPPTAAAKSSDDDDDDDNSDDSSSASFKSNDSDEEAEPVPAVPVPVATKAATKAAAAAVAKLKHSGSGSAKPSVSPPRQSFEAPCDNPAESVPAPGDATLNALFSAALPEEPVHLASTSAARGGEKLPAFTWGSYAPETLETMCVQKASATTEVKRLDVPREQGRCIGPVDGEPGDAPAPLSFQKLAVDFFAAKQVLVTPSPELVEHTHWAAAASDSGTAISHERRDKGQLAMSEAQFSHELGGSLEDPASMRRAASEPIAVPLESVARDPAAAISSIAAKYSDCDVVQLLEAARDAKLPHPTTSAKIWTYDYEPRNPVAMPPMFRDGMLYSVNVKECWTNLQHMSGPDVEPTFGSIAIYSISNKEAKRVSETFYFDVNIAANQKQYFKDKPAPHIANTLKRFVTFIPSAFRHSDLYVVTKLHRLATDDHDSAIDMYLRPGAWVKSKKHFDKHVARLGDYTKSSIGEIATEVGWFASSMRTPNGVFQGTTVVDKLFVTPRYTVASDSFIFDAIVNNKWKSFKTLQCQMAIECTDVSKYEVSVATSSRGPAAAIEEETVLMLRSAPDAKQELVRHCPTVFPVLNAGFFNTFANAMYVNLHQLNLYRLATKEAKDAKHFVVKVALKDNDNDLYESEGVPCVFTRWFGSSLIGTSALSQVVVGLKDCDLSDEFKIQLPLVLTEKHHLLFTIYAVTVDYRSGAPKPLVPIGYATQRVYENRRALPASQISVPVIVGGPASAALKAGYLGTKIDKSAYVTDGAKVFTFSTSLRSTIYSEVPLIADIFNDFEAILRFSQDTRKGGNIFDKVGRAANHKVDAKSETDIVRRLTEIEHLAQPEKLAFYPRLVSFLLALICAPSYNIGTRARCLAFKAFARVSSEVHQLESAGARPPQPASPLKKPVGSPVQPPRGVPLTSPVKFVYHYVTEQVLFDGDQRYDLALGVAEILTAELIRSRRNEQLQSYKAMLNNHLWLFFDLILKGVYLAANRPRAAPKQAVAAQPPVEFPPGATDKEKKKLKKAAAVAAAAAAAIAPKPKPPAIPTRAELFGESFYAAIYTLLDEVVETFVRAENRLVVSRAALFLRNLSLVADRGHVLSVFQAFMRRLIGKQCVSNIEIALTSFTDGAVTVLATLGPRMPLDASPVGITRILLRRVLPLMWDSSRDMRRRGQDVLYRIIVRTSRQVTKLAPEESQEQLARGLISYVAAMANFYPRLVAIMNKDTSSSQTSSAIELRYVLGPLLWTLQWAPRKLVRAFIAGITNPTMLTGLLAMLRDSFVLFRHSPPSSKLAAGLKASEQQIKALLPWDSRLEAQAYSICVRALSVVVTEHSEGLLRAVGDYPVPAVAAHLFGALDVALSIGAPTAMLQAGACLLRQVVNALSIELLSGRAALAQRVVASALHLMTSTSAGVRSIASQALLQFARRHFELHGDIARFHVMCVSETIRVAEHDCKDRPKAADSFGGALAALVEECSEHWETLTLEQRTRFVPSTQATQAAAATAKQRGSSPPQPPTGKKQPVSVRPIFNVAGGESEANRRVAASRGATDFAGAFERTVDTCGDFFTVVSRMAQSSHFEVKTIAVFELVRKLLKDRALGEAVRWLRELAAMHGKQNGAVEGGLAVFAIAALVFRATQMAYHIFGESAGGIAIPHAMVFEHIHWHHFTRVFPQVEQMVPEEEMHLIVAEQVNLPPLPEFTLSGLVDLLKDAGDRLARAYHYEWAVPVFGMVQTLAGAANDYTVVAAVSDEIRKCATALVRGNTARLGARFFAVTVHGARLADTVQWVIRYPDSSKMNVEAFRKVAVGIAEAVTGASREDVELREDLSAEDMIKITDEAKAARNKKPKKSSKKKPTSDNAAPADNAAERKVYVACHEVVQYFADGDERTRGGVASLLNLDAFSCKIQMVDRDAALESGVQSLGTAFSMNDEARHFEPLARRQRIVIHRLARSFPSLTNAVAVDGSEESTLDPVATAIADLRDHRQTLVSIAPDCPPAFAIKQTIAALTPFNIRPAGFYFKAVLHALGHDDELRDVAAEFVEELKQKSGVFHSAAARDPETLAKFIKATIDVECALSDAVDTAKAVKAAEEAGDASDTDVAVGDDHDDALHNKSRSLALGNDDEDAEDVPAEFEGDDSGTDDSDGSDDSSSD